MGTMSDCFPWYQATLSNFWDWNVKNYTTYGLRLCHILEKCIWSQFKIYFTLVDVDTAAASYCSSCSLTNKHFDICYIVQSFSVLDVLCIYYLFSTVFIELQVSMKLLDLVCFGHRGIQLRFFLSPNYRLLGLGSRMWNTFWVKFSF